MTTEDRLSEVYVGQFWEDDEEDLIEEITCSTGFLRQNVLIIVTFSDDYFKKHKCSKLQNLMDLRLS